MTIGLGLPGRIQGPERGSSSTPAEWVGLITRERRSEPLQTRQVRNRTGFERAREQREVEVAGNGSTVRSVEWMVEPVRR